MSDRRIAVPVTGRVKDTAANGANLPSPRVPQGDPAGSGSGQRGPAPKIAEHGRRQAARLELHNGCRAASVPRRPASPGASGARAGEGVAAAMPHHVRSSKRGPRCCQRDRRPHIHGLDRGDGSRGARLSPGAATVSPLPRGSDAGDRRRLVAGNAHFLAGREDLAPRRGVDRHAVLQAFGFPLALGLAGDAHLVEALGGRRLAQPARRTPRSRAGSGRTVPSFSGSITIVSMLLRPSSCLRRAGGRCSPPVSAPPSSSAISARPEPLCSPKGRIAP